MKIINLLPKTEARENQLHLAGMQVLNFWFYAGVSLVIVFILSLAVLILMRGKITATDNAINLKKQELASSDTQKVEATVTGLNNQIRNIKTLQAANYQWSKVIVELTNVTPEGVHLSAVDLDRATNKIEVAGVADTRDEVIAFWSNVKKSRFFEKINFPFTNLENEQNSSFTYTFYVKSDQIKNESAK